VGKVKFAWYENGKLNFECATAPEKWDGKILISWEDFLNRNGDMVEIRHPSGKLYLHADMVLIFTRLKLDRKLLEEMGCVFD